VIVFATQAAPLSLVAMLWFFTRDGAMVSRGWVPE
jgi:hypothetical protein